ncbi:hypothetical protein FB2170_11241 [Maribacter sp. HTCC2170]|nr:hypothetical protein FB2170_11241 [Maribacter sp. HTCC2170]
MISEFIFYTDDATKEEKSTYIDHKIHIRELLNDDFDRKVLASTLIELRKDVSGQAQNQLIDLYKNLGLHLDAYEKLKSWRWEVVAKGILELTQMQVTESYQVIVRFINDRRSTVRKQAEIATITLKNEGIMYFMDTTKYKISEWQQLSLLEILRNNKDFDPPQFKAWLTSKNKHVVLFALRLIKHYSQNDAKAALIELLKHRNDHIKLEAIGCLKIFNVVESKDMLKLVFWRCSTEVKIAILGAISELGDTGDIGFLKQIERKRLDFTVKSKALSAINSIVPESIMPTEGIEKVSNIKIPEDAIENSTEKEVKEDAQIEYEDYKTQDSLPKDLNSQLIAGEEEPQSNIDAEGLEVRDLEVNYEELDFLPIVSAESEDEIQDNIKDLDIDYEELVVECANNEEQMELECPEIDLTDRELDFLPIVTADETTIEINDILENIEVVYDEIKATQEIKEDTETIDNSEFVTTKEDLKFLPIVVSDDIDDVLTNDNDLFEKSIEEFDKEYNQALIEKERTVIEEILESNFRMEQERLAEISTIEVECEELISDEKVVAEDNDFIDWATTKDEETEIYDTNEEFEIESILSLIPKSYKFDDRTIILIQLLSDIEQLGDHREIPLLTDLLLEEPRPLIRERIQDVIYGIEKKNDLKNETVRHSVFEELFKSCDTESKFILMDQMVAIGDEKEFVFLTKLLEDTNIEISTKAESTLRLLEERLSDKALREMNVEAHDLTGSHKISLTDQDEDLLVFTDEFILESQEGDLINNMNQPISDTNLNTGFLSQLMSIPNRLLEKLNE